MSVSVAARALVAGIRVVVARVATVFNAVAARDIVACATGFRCCPL